MCRVELVLRTLVIGALCCISRFSDAAWLRCYKSSLQDSFVTPLDKPLALMNTTCIDLARPTVFYTFGYRGRANGPATTAMLTAYIATRKRNVILLDWEDEAKSGLFGIPLGYAFSAVPNAKNTGKYLGEAVITLANAGMNMSQIHMLGHSLGAHVMAYAGKHVREKGYVVSRITGLDPARALFEGTLTTQSGIDRTCAKFVDIIHSDPGGYGTSTPTGSVDIWPNYSGSGGTQPGCLSGDFDMFSPEDLCNHDRSWRYYVEAISSPTAFPAALAEDYDTWVARKGETTQTVYMGDLTSTRARGNFYLTTNALPSYGKGAEGLKPDNNPPRRRRNSTLYRLLKYLR